MASKQAPVRSLTKVAFSSSSSSSSSSSCFASPSTCLSCLRIARPHPVAPSAPRKMSSSPPLRSLNINNINQNIRRAEYAVRGELAVRAEKYRQKLKDDRPPTPSTSPNESLPFDSVVSANIGNPQQLDQKPLTFFRQIASLCENPELLEKEKVLIDHLGYKQDVIDRARWLLSDVQSVGAYSPSQGAVGIRKSIARFIEERDGFPSHPDSIFLAAGASSAVTTMLNVICGSPSTGVLVPIPQYPLYTATLAILNAHAVEYYLDEATNWSTNLDVIKSSLASARDKGIDVRALVVINPGNPTGGILNPTEIFELIQLAAKEKLVIMADEVYQQNVFQGQFTSFKKTLREMQRQKPGEFDGVELVSFHSISKGMVGECGHRGGYMELVGFDLEVVAQIYKFVSVSLCPPVIGQCMVECLVNPPKKGDPSYEVYEKEYNHVFNGLHERALALYEAFKEMEGVECRKPEGAMYLFPSIRIPERAKERAQKEQRTPDEYYISRMLDATGVCMVPGSGFGQMEGTYHFRTTFLPPGTEWIGRLKKFHEEFMKEFGYVQG